MSKGRPKLEPYTAISIRFPNDLHAAITEAAGKCDPKMSFSSFVVKAVKEKLSGVHHHPETTVVVEAADTAPLLAQISELEKRLNEPNDRLAEIEAKLEQLDSAKRLDDFESRLQSQIDAKLNIIRASIPKEQHSDPALIEKLIQLEQEVSQLANRLNEEIKQLDAVLSDQRIRDDAKGGDDADKLKLVQKLAKHGEGKDTNPREKKSETNQTRSDSEISASDVPNGDEEEESPAIETEVGEDTSSPTYASATIIRVTGNSLGWMYDQPVELEKNDLFRIVIDTGEYIKAFPCGFSSATQIIPLGVTPVKIRKSDIEVLPGDQKYFSSIFDDDEFENLRNEALKLVKPLTTIFWA